MKLFILALVILLILVILEVTSFYKEGLETGPTASNSGMGNITLITSNNKEPKYVAKILGGSLLTIKDKLIPYTYEYDTIVIDPNLYDVYYKNES